MAPNELEQQLADAKKSDQYMVAIWHVTAEGKLKLFRVTANFPVGDFSESVAMLHRDLNPNSPATTTPVPQ
jgi:hypothetical protein